MTLPVLYTFIRCPWAMRARIALAQANIEYISHEVNLKNKPPELLEISPKGTVPVLVLPDGTVIDESLEIILWAMPDNITSSMLDLIKMNDLEFKKNVSHYKYPTRYPDDPQSTQFYRAAAESYISQLEAMLQSQPYLFGTEISVADIAIFPLVRQFSMVEPQWFVQSVYTNTNMWIQRINASPAFQRAMCKAQVTNT